MNKIFRVIWNHATQSWIAVSELSKTKGKSKSSSGKKISLLAISLTTAGATLLGSTAQAAISGDAVIWGSNSAGTKAPEIVVQKDPFGNPMGEYSIGIAPGQVKFLGEGKDKEVNVTNATKPLYVYDSNTGALLDYVPIGGSLSKTYNTEVTRLEYSGEWVARPTGRYSISIGQSSEAGSMQSVTLGRFSKVDNASLEGYVIGSQSNVTKSEQGVQVGSRSNVNASARGILVGNRGNVTNSDYASAIGSYGVNVTNSGYSSSVGTNTITNQSYGAINIGPHGKVDNSQLATNVGPWSEINRSEQAIAVGRNAKALDSVASTVVGTYAKANVSNNSVAVGRNANVDNSEFGVTVGPYTNILGSQQATALGRNAKVDSSRSGVALGTFAVVNGSVSATAVGPGANVLNSEGGFSGGRNSKVENSKDGTALGVGATISGAANATALGARANATLADSVALGADAITSAATPTNSASVNGINYSGFAGVNNDTNYVVSVGKNGGERQVQNVAAGRITENSTDAINGSQLYHVLATGSWTIGDQTDHSGNGVNNVRFGDRVDFIGSGATTVNVSKTADNKTLVNISSPVYTAGNNINLTTNSDGSITISSSGSDTLSNLTSHLPDTSKVANPNGSDVNKQDAPTTLTDDNRKEAATVQDVLNTGWNLQGNGVEKDFVAAYDTVNFANGTATDVVVDNKDGKLSNITFNVKYDNSTIVLDENGNLKANLSNIINGDNTTTEANNGTVSVKTGDITANTTTGKADFNTTNGTIAKVEDVANAINHSGWKTNAKDTNGNDVTDVLVNPGDTVNYVDGNGTKANVTVTKGENGNPDVFNVTYDVNTTNAVANTTTGKAELPDATKGGDTLNATTITNLVNNVFHTVNATNKDEQIEATNGTTTVKAGDTLDFVAGKNLVVNQTGKTIAFGLSRDIDVGNITAGNVTVGDTVLTNGTLSNLTSHLPDTSKVATPSSDNKNEQTAPTDIANKGNEAATVKDVLNAGWNLQGNGEAKDFVAAYDTVNFANGSATDVVVDNKDGKLSNITFNVKYDNSTIVLDENGNLKANVSNIINGDNTTTEANNGTVSVKTGDITANTTTGKADFNTANGTIAKVEDVAGAINGSGWKTTPTKVFDKDGNEVNNPTDQLINPGDQVNYVNGNGTKANVTVTQGQDGKDTVNVSYDIKPADETIAVTSEGVKANTTTGSVNDNGTVTVEKPNLLLNASEVANLVNNASFNVTTAKNDEQVTSGGHNSKPVKAGDTVTYKAGKNLEINQDGHNITYGLSENITVNQANATTLTVGNVSDSSAPKVDFNAEKATPANVNPNATAPENALNITTAGKPTQITGVGSVLNVGDVPTNTGDEKDVSGNVTKAGTTGNDKLVNLTNLPDNTLNSAATVRDLTNLGWVVNASDNNYTNTVKNANKVDFVGGDAITVSGSNDGDIRKITVTAKYDNATIVLDENGRLKANVSNIINGDNTTTEANNGTVSVKTGDVTANTTTGKAESNTANGTIAKVEDVANAINHSGWKTNAKDTNGNDVTDVLVNPGDTVNYVDGNGTKANVTVTKGENGNPDVFNVTYDVNTTNAVANTTTGKAELPDATKGGDTLNATTITNLVNNVFHTVNATNKDEQIEATNGTTTVKAGDTLDFVAGKNLVVNQTGKTIAFGLSKDIDVGNITAGNVTVGNTTITNGTISGLNPNLPNTNNNDEYKVGDEITKSQTLPSTLNITNAATVGDILNSGWNLQNNGQARDFVKPYDSVNFVNGTATTAVVETEANGTVSNVTYNVNVDDSTIKVVDGKLVANATNIVNQVTGNSTVTDGKANATTVDQAGNQVDNSNKIATVGDIVNTINNVHWNATAGNVTGTNGEFSSTGSSPIKAGDTVAYNAGKNIKIEQNGKTFNISTTDNVTFTHTNTTTLTVGNVSDPNHSTNITSGPEGLNVNGDKITGVANGTISNNSSDAVNGSQLYSVGDSIKNIFGGNTTFNTTTGKVEGFERVLNTTGLAPSENYTIPAASATNITEAFEQLNNYVNAGWKLGNASGAVVERISPDEQVNFVDSNTITSTVVANDKGGANISFNVNATAVANNAAGNVSANSTTGKAEFDNHNNTKPLATVEDVAKTVNNTGWFMNTTAGEKALVNPGDTVNYVDGNGTKANVTVTKGENGNPDTFNVTYDIKSADNTIAVTPEGVKVNTTTGSVNDNGTVKVAQPDLLLNASEVANLVNNASFNATIGRDDTDFVDQVGKDNYKVKAGDTITFNAGKNLRVKQENGTFTYALDNNITVNHANATALTVGNVSNPTAPKVDFNAEEAKPATNNQEAPKNALNITTDGKPTQITGVGSTLNTTNVVTNPDGNASTPVENKTLVDLTNATTPDSAATVRDLQNMGWVVETSGNGYVDTVKNANHVKFSGDGAVTVTGSTDANGTRNITVRVDATQMANNAAGNVYANTTTGKAEFNNANGSKPLATVEDVASAINGSGWELNSASVGGEVIGDTAATRVNPGSKVNINAGKNVVITRSGKDITIATSAKPVFENVQVGGDKGPIIGGDENGDVKVSKADGSPTKVTNVAAGTASTDAVNVGQLKGTVGNINNRMNKMNKDLRGGIAGANAAAGLPQVYIPGKSMVAASAGTFKGQSAVAVGYSRASDNGKLILKLQGNANTRGDLGGSVGVGYQW
ncbi:YadA-like family protein [Rodentibacter pneumotropicus]|uniref:YadA-like family protein n=3 Tax=Rodentibacter pneumotropicus TaxID=758 RepID=A0AAW5LI61_9PAST|nr:YadA-like family protein [Rodentibacter pneumotropicus]MCQ9122276.1 YadA-like family protein [Rodentibacter pneumotropicus]